MGSIEAGPTVFVAVGENPISKRISLYPQNYAYFNKKGILSYFFTKGPENIFGAKMFSEVTGQSLVITYKKGSGFIYAGFGSGRNPSHNEMVTDVWDLAVINGVILTSFVFCCCFVVCCCVGFIWKAGNKNEIINPENNYHSIDYQQSYVRQQQPGWNN